ncbi:hypothetical protein AB0O34_02335 [Sphaerisporangium sp. NPDC088356]|uniref:hypothetical protein n=1 Tax=Sphaerisporangium sp. NPDC088356 TaxID=3154871 RepID=UPI0034206378
MLSAVSTFAAAIAAGGAWWAASKSNSTAEKSNELADIVKTIEQRRWHSELHPHFEVRCVPEHGDRVELRIQLLRPLALDKLTIRASIRDDWPDRAPVTAGEPTQEQIDTTIWGPYRFADSADGANKIGRIVAPFELAMGDGRPFSLTPTMYPRWTTPEIWADRYKGTRIRLALHCTHPDYAPWVVHEEVSVD